MDTKATIFKNEDWELFCSAGTLSQKAGVSKDKIGLLVLKELTDNALDITTNVKVGYRGKNGDGHFFVKNDGDGIPGSDEEIADLFSIKRPLLSTKRIRLPYRGALGNGLRVVAGAIISYGGSLEVSTRGRILKLSPQESGNTLFERVGDYDDNGTLIKMQIDSFYEDSLCWARLATCMAGGESYKGKTSPCWYDSDSFYALLRATQGNITIREFIAKNFDGCSGRKAGHIVADSYAGRITNTITREESTQILKKARLMASEVKPKRLGFVGDRFENSIAYHREECLFEVTAGRGDISAKIPAIIEFWAFNGSDFKSQFFVNRTPIAGNVEVTFQKDYLYISGCGLSTYKEKKFKVKPAIWVNVITPYMPITTDGKEPNFEYLKESILSGIEKIAGKIIRRLPKELKKSKVTIRDVVKKHLDAAIAKASGNGEYRYSLRQLFYAIRPYVLDALNKEPDYQYFGGIITDIEAERGQDLPLIYRDSRGTILHPHTKDEIALGTLNVEVYKRPEYCFNKILYLEKEGFFELMKDNRWVEINDCAVISSKGFSSRAARDLLDLLGKSDEEIEFFCIHDLDAYGTMIYQTLQQETKARKARNVKIIDLGLTMKDIQTMNLQIEKVVIRKNKNREDIRKPVGDNYKEHEEWLQNHRVELNSMDSPTFIDWITKKVKEHGNGKLIPSENVLYAEAMDRAEQELRGRVREKIEIQLKINELINAEVDRLFPSVKADLERVDLLSRVKEGLNNNPVDIWRKPIEIIAIDKVYSGMS